MATLSGVAVGATGDLLVGAPVVATLVDPGTKRAIKGQVGDRTTIRRHQTKTDGSGAWELDLEPNADLDWPTGAAWAIEFDNDKQPIIIRKGPGAETLTADIILDDTALPATPAAVIGEVARQVATLGPGDVGADPAGTGAAEAAGVSAALTPQIADRIPYDDVDVVVDSAGQGRQHLDAARGWLHGLAEAERGERAARVVVMADSMGELSSGLARVWQEVSRRLGGDVGTWQPAAFSASPQLEGITAPMLATWGLDRRGATVPAATTFGRWTDYIIVPMPSIPTTLDIYYTAHPSGSEVSVTVDGVVVGSFDSSLDENGDPVAVSTPGQRWRSPHVGDLSTTWSATTGATGTLRLEAVSYPGSGVEQQGRGLAGTTTAVTTPVLLAHLTAMVARDEPPDLVVLYADTAEAATGAAAAVAALVPQIRALCPLTSILHVIPAGHSNWGPPEDQAAQAAIHRANDATLDVMVADLFAAMGPITNTVDPYGWSSDGVHFSTKGKVASEQVVLDVVASRNVSADVELRATALAAASSALDAADTAQDAAVAAQGTADAAVPAVAAGGKLYPPRAATLGGFFPAVVAGLGKSSDAHPRVGWYQSDSAGVGVVIGDGTTAPSTPALVLGASTISLSGKRLVEVTAPTALTDAANLAHTAGGSTVTVAASRDFVNGDCGRTLLVNGAVTLTMPSTLFVVAWPLGASCTIVQDGASPVTIAAPALALYAPNGAASTTEGQEGTLRRLGNTRWSITWH